uniref:receptor protein-tyrosine kinase CEPR2 isoform X2 n=1 Tax=Erigeron canadensis TaxID=72917 RepID=UPI001CB99BA9|nr:receptor protein-tyrosine kinase CEPR2 isoform X2 [Erigeron canadensis]
MCTKAVVDIFQYRSVCSPLPDRPKLTPSMSPSLFVPSRGPKYRVYVSLICYSYSVSVGRLIVLLFAIIAISENSPLYKLYYPIQSNPSWLHHHRFVSRRVMSKSSSPPAAASRKITTSAVMIFFIVVISSSSTVVSDSGDNNNNVEVEALLELKKHLNDPLNYLQDSWNNNDNNPCNFYGVLCDNHTGRVTEISLNWKSLSGKISPSIGSLHGLRSLVIPSNYLSGDLPASIANCTNLRVLNISANNFTGQLPDLSNLINLRILDISENDFNRQFPTWVGKLTSLTSLGLGDNNYEDGVIPDSLGNLKNLTWLYLRGSQRTGQIPDSIFHNLKQLQTLDLAANKLSGDFPLGITNLKNLWKIELFGNRLTGVIPPQLAQLNLLQEFDISANQMHGQLPTDIGNMNNLTVFQCFMNQFSGQLPPGFGDMQHLKGFSIYRNNFSGNFPRNFAKFAPLVEIDISENNFSGGFPKFLCGGGVLEKLLALGNDFSGEFPENYAECKSLLRLRVGQNQLSGKIPQGLLWALPFVDLIDLSDNNFSGEIIIIMSPRIGAANSTSLTQLLLFDNRFSGVIPSQVGTLLTRLEKLDLSNNKFSGKIPSEFQNLKQLSSLHLHNNLLSGSIPVELGECDKLVDLNLARNFLTGKIPDTLGDISWLNTLNLSQNLLTGVIPDNLRRLRLSSIDLSVNRLSGVIPSDLLNMGANDAFAGNQKLCVNENYYSRRNVNVGLDVCETTKHHLHQVNKTKLVLICIILLFSLMVVLGGLMYASLRIKTDTKHDLSNDEKGPKWKLENFHQIEFDADELCDLDERNLIGVGGTGKVYRVDLKKSGLTVAVKQIWNRKQGNKVQVITTEIGILGKIRHRNILKLYACLVKGGSSFLVFEHMVNGSLYEALARVFKNGQPELDWVQRYKIAIGVAKGIAYLHHDCTPTILHRDIKSSNILLDKDFEPKIADFGVAKMTNEECFVSDSNCFVGTHGYIAPDDDLVDDMKKVLKIALLCTSKLPNLRPSMREVVKMLTDAEPCNGIRLRDDRDKFAKLLF